MSLPAFSAIIASYVPNHGNLGPSGSYNAWVNKINKRKDRCNSIACTNTPDDIWNVKFDECDEGCSAQGDDKCVSNFCDALADVYDYTRRLEEEDVDASEFDDAKFQIFIKGKFSQKDSQGREISRPVRERWSVSQTYNAWIESIVRARDHQIIDVESLVNEGFPGCTKGCQTTTKGFTARKENSYCQKGGNYCKALTSIDTNRYDAMTGNRLDSLFSPEIFETPEKLRDQTKRFMQLASSEEKRAANSPSLEFTWEHNMKYVLCSQLPPAERPHTEMCTNYIGWPEDECTTGVIDMEQKGQTCAGAEWIEPLTR